MSARLEWLTPPRPHRTCCGGEMKPVTTPRSPARSPMVFGHPDGDDGTQPFGELPSSCT